MKSDLSTKLKKLLDNMSQDQFDASWAEITALNLDGPTLDEYFLTKVSHYKVVKIKYKILLLIKLYFKRK